MAAGAFDHLKATYFQECAELLESVYACLAALEAGRGDDETVHAIFRAVHSIKGGGGAFAFDRMVGFAHVLETLLDLVRDGKVALDGELAALLLRATDALSDLIGAERTGAAVAAGFEDALLAELQRRAGGELPSPVAAAGWRIRFQPHAGLFRSANEPLLVIRDLQRLGPMRVTVDLARLPALERIEPELAYLGWIFEVATGEDRAAIEAAFEFVADQCDLTIEPLVPAAAAPVIEAPPPPPAETMRRDAPGGAQTVRVDVEKVDRLVNLVGELVINQAMLVQLGAALPAELCAGLITGLETLSQHLRELQDGVMAIRTQPVKSVFSRMPRLVRELSGQLGKDVRLVITGEATEIDKTVIEQLADPLTHLLRNALDHGIEQPDERVAQGKPAQGMIHLAAEHRSGRIVIEVADDGRGIDRARVLARARQRGLIGEAATPSEEEIDNLIFLPGFSTSEVVSNISGRGVGMDVVRRNIQALGGRIGLQSRRGAGSRFVLSLPLTLAILDGMIVAVGGESYIVPLTNIIESLRPKRHEIHAVAGCGDVVSIRDRYVPLIYLARHFRVPDAIGDPSHGIVVVVETEGAGQLGLVVDELVGQQQVVVKSLEANYGAVEGIGGATILGNGRVALILDVAGLRGPAGVGAEREASRADSAAMALQ